MDGMLGQGAWDLAILRRRTHRLEMQANLKGQGVGGPRAISECGASVLSSAPDYGLVLVHTLGGSGDSSNSFILTIHGEAWVEFQPIASALVGFWALSLKQIILVVDVIILM